MSVVGDILGRLQYEIITPLMTVVFAVGFLLFIWGLAKFMMNVEEGSSSSQSEGRQHMIWGVVGMLIMVSFWGIIGLIDNTLGLGIGSNSSDQGRNQVPDVIFTRE
jgi:hypothetical protein